MERLAAILDNTAMCWGIAISWSALLTLFLLQPEADPVIDLGLPKGESSLAREFFFSAAHLIAFGITCFWWFWALQRNCRVRTSLAAACLLAILLGGVTEILQGYTLDRHASWLDLVANFSGTMLAARLIWRRFA